MRFARELAVLGTLIGWLEFPSADASESAAGPSRRLSIEVVTEGSRAPFEDAVVAVAMQQASGTWYSAGRMRTDATGRSSLEIDASVTALHILVVCAHGDRVLSGDAAVDVSRSTASPLSVEVSIEFASREAVECSAAAEPRISAPRWPRPIPAPRIPRLPPPDPGRCDPFPCPPIQRVDPT